MTDGPHQRDALKAKIRNMIADGHFPAARVRVRQFVFGPPVNYEVLFRVVGPDANGLRRIGRQVQEVMEANPNLRNVHLDWTERTPIQRLVFDQDRLRLIGLTPQEASQQLAAILNGVPATSMRDGIRSVEVMLRSPKSERSNLDELENLTLTTRYGTSVPLAQVARLETQMEDAASSGITEQYIAVQADVIDGVQPPDVSAGAAETGADQRKAATATASTLVVH